MNDDKFVVQKTSPQKLLADFLTVSERALLNEAIKQAYRDVLADSEKISWFTERFGSGVLSRLRTMGIDYFLQLLEAKQLVPIHFSTERNQRGNSKYLLGTTDDGRACFTVNQVTNTHRSSQAAKYRQARHRDFESYFDFFDEGSLITEGPRYFELNHGYRGTEPKFITLGIPNEAQGWYACDNILASTPLALKVNRPAMSVVNPIKEYDKEDFQKFIFGKGAL